MIRNQFILLCILTSCALYGQVPSAAELVNIHKLTTIQGDTLSNLEIGMLSYNITDGLLKVNTTSGWSNVTEDKSPDNELIDSFENNADSLRVFQNNGSVVSGHTDVTTYMGKFIIEANGSIAISGIPFRPSYIEFDAYANVDTLFLNADNEVGDNNATKDNVFGAMHGFVQEYNGSTTQQFIFIGGSGRSINDISRFSSDNACIGLRYSNTNGDNLGETVAAFTSFQDNGFTIDVTDSDDKVLVIFTAFR